MPDAPDLPPTGRSRRDFLKGALASGAAAAAGGIAGLPAVAAAAIADSRVPLSAAARPVTLRIDGKALTRALEPRVTLLDAMREHLGITGPKKGCDHGQCGACTVLIGDRRVISCLTLAVMHEGHTITTVEGLATGETLHPLQQAFITHDAFQCGYCTPGQLCSAIGLMREGGATSDAAIREGMAGNLCRCGAYPNIVAAIRATQAGSAQ